MSKFIPEPNTGCWLWTGGTDSNGYGKIMLNYKVLGAHRVSWEVHHGPIPPGLYVCHKCDVPGCVNPDHLFLGTHRENMRDKMAKGRANTPFGSPHANAKLNENQVRIIKRLLSFGTVAQTDIAAAFGVNQRTVSNIKINKGWAHVRNTGACGDRADVYAK